MSWPAYLEQWRGVCAKAGTAWGVPFSLLAAICDRESRGGEALRPPGPGGRGDAGHGHGLFQIDDRTWGTWLATHEWWLPEVNADKGASILATSLREFGRLQEAVAAYNCGPEKVRRLHIMRPQPTLAELDVLTTGRDYVTWVVRRWHELDGIPDFSDVTGGSSMV